VIWNDKRIIEWALAGGINPYDPEMVNPASIDLKLGETMRVPKWYWIKPLASIAYKMGWPQWSDEFEFSTYLMAPGQFVLCCSLEKTKVPDNAVATLALKSSIGRRGVEHLHAGYGDPGFGDNEEGGCSWTWEMVNAAPWPNLLTAKRPLIQLIMYSVERPLKLYKEVGRYNQQVGPTPERR